MDVVVHLVRHGQTIVNVTGQRIYDPGLTPAGQAQALRLAQALRSAGLTRIVCSPLLRALQTAQAVRAACGAPLVVCNDLVEVNAWGPYRGLTRAELTGRFPEAQVPPDMPAAGWAYPGPETEEQAQVRVHRVVRAVAALPSGSRIALIAHGNFNVRLLRVWLRAAADGAEVVQDNACINTLRLRTGGVAVLRLNDTAHLHPGGRPVPPLCR